MSIWTKQLLKIQVELDPWFICLTTFNILIIILKFHST